jgi:hypothetical protein
MIELPELTLACVDTRTPDLALAAIERCRAQILFGAAVLVTEPALVPKPPPGLRLAAATIDSTAAYSTFMLRGLLPLVQSSHALVVQWDGYVLDATRWERGFLDWDYIGAPLRGESGKRAVGNGGFSLRSRRLLAALQDPSFTPRHPEDLCICHDHRERLEREFGIRFAPADVASRFAYERVAPSGPTFGFHGLFNLHRVLPIGELHALLRQLPDEMARGLDAHDLARTLIELGELDTAAEILAKRRRLRMHDRRTLRLRLLHALARRQAAR